MTVSSRFLTGACVAAFLFAGCGGAYNAEKAYWEMSRKHEKAIAAPSAASPADFEAAASSVRSIVEKYPYWGKAAELQFTLARMYAERNDSETAEKEWIKVYTDFPKSTEIGARALFAIGRIYEQRKDMPGALRRYQEILERYPVTSTGLQLPLYIVQLHMREGNAEESAKAAEKAFRSYGNLVDTNPFGKGVSTVHELTVSLLGFQGRWNDAASLLEKFAAKYPAAEAAPMALYRAALIYQDQLKDAGKAVPLFQKIIAGYPKSKLIEPAQMEIGAVALGQGNFDQARLEFDKVLKGKPENTSLKASARLAMAAGYEKAGRWDEALEEYRQLQKEQPQSDEALQVPLLIARYYQAKGSIAKRDEELDQAIQSYGELISGTGKKAGPQAYEFLAGAYIMQQKWHETIVTLEKLCARYPQNARSADALLSIGMIYSEKLNDTVNGRRALQQFLDKYPRHPQAVVVKAMLNQEEKR